MEQKNLDPEKIKLLKEKHKEKKKTNKSRSKIARELYDSSSTDRFQQPKRKSNSVHDVDKEIYDYGRRDVFETYEGETKGDWYRDQQKKLRESPSRVSCALKKLLGSEYACVGCLVIVFVVTILAGLLLAFKTVPSSNETLAVDRNPVKEQRAKGKRQLNDYDIYGGRRYKEKSSNDDFQFPSFSTATEKKEFAYTGLPEQSSSDDIANILNVDEIMESDNKKLRDFYKRLIETDSEIKRVKQNLQSNYLKIRNDHELERIKRSLNKTQAHRQGLYHKNKHLNISSKMRHKRLNNGSDDVYGIVIKEQEIIVYKPRGNNSKETVHNVNRNIYKKHFKHPLCKHKQQFHNFVTQNNLELKEEKKIERNTTDYDNYKVYFKTQKVNESLRSNNSEDTSDEPPVENLDILSNITIDKDNNILRNSKSVIRRRRKNDKAQKFENINISKSLIRKDKSLVSNEEENKFTKTEIDKLININHYTNGSDLKYHGDYKYRSRRLFQYDTSALSDIVTSSTLNTLNTASATGELYYNIFPEISPPDFNLNRVNKSISSTTKYLTNKIKVTPKYDDKLGESWDELKDKKIQRNEFSKKTKIQKSKEWLKNQMRKLINKRKKSKKSMENSYDSLSSKAMNVEESFQSISNQRKIRTPEYDNDKNMENIFEKLNAKMETVCREAAYAIQNKRNIKVRESKADITTSNLMHRLVRMMTDLLDIQVQEKTCVELPEDLRQFLDWLVPPTKANPQADNLNPDISDYVAAKRKYAGGIDESNDVTEQPLSFAEDSDQAEVYRIQCMETIRAVQDLVDQYEGLPREDKNKLFGVKDYLQSQLQYLNKMAGDIDTENYNFYEDPENRLKRETDKIKRKRKISKRLKDNRFKDLTQKIKNKHTKASTQAMNSSFTNNLTFKDQDMSFTGQI